MQAQLAAGRSSPAELIQMQQELLDLEMQRAELKGETSALIQLSKEQLDLLDELEKRVLTLVEEGRSLPGELLSVRRQKLAVQRDLIRLENR